MHPHHRVILRALAHRHRLVRQIRQPQHQLVPRRLRFRRLLVQLRDPVAQVAGFLLLRLGLRDFLLAHQRADFFGHALALGLERFDLAQQLAPLLVQLEQLVNAGLIPCPARRQALAHKIRPFTNQFDVEHRRIIGATRLAARRKGASLACRGLALVARHRHANPITQALARFLSEVDPRADAIDSRFRPSEFGFLSAFGLRTSDLPRRFRLCTFASSGSDSSHRPNEYADPSPALPGRVASLHLHPPEPGTPLQAVEAVEVIAGRGIQDDTRYFGRLSRDTGQPTRRQVTLIEREQIAEHAAALRLPSIPPGVVRSNIETMGINLISLLGHEVEIGSALLLLHTPRAIPARRWTPFARALRALMMNSRQGVAR